MKRFLILSLLIWLFSVGNQVVQSQGSMNIMTFNIRLDHEGDGQHNWRYRKNYAAELLVNESVDIVGTQEVLKNQLDDLLELSPQYAYVGVGRFDGKTGGEYSAILYKRNRFEVIRSGNFWLSETPDSIGSKGWDAACERIVTWAIFNDLSTGESFAFFNTHFDHMGQIARIKSAELIVEKAHQIAENLPVILCGDFNGSPDSKPIQSILESGWLKNTYSIANRKSGPSWSFHDFGRLPVDQRQLIDFIFVTDSFQVLSYKNIFKEINNTFYSDHNPIVVQMLIAD
ncbi:MAG: Uncharacterized protein FD155_2533 [Bacteroidetes bacterium]|nr:MAG: Uncharacterized protein FD155_2533 [Bacteroidota bacterium]